MLYQNHAKLHSCISDQNYCNYTVKPSCYKNYLNDKSRMWKHPNQMIKLECIHLLTFFIANVDIELFFDTKSIQVHIWYMKTITHQIMQPTSTNQKDCAASVLWIAIHYEKITISLPYKPVKAKTLLRMQ